VSRVGLIPVCMGMTDKEQNNGGTPRLISSLDNLRQQVI
jgi:hypothetical protein